MYIIYDYYGLEICFRDEACLPITVYGRRNDRESIAIIQFRDGLLLPHEFRSSTNELDTDDQHAFDRLLEKNASELIKFWIDIFLYRKHIETEIIKSKIDSPPGRR